VRELEDDITIGIMMGKISFSFKTDREGSNVRSTVKAVKEVASTHAQLFKSLGSERFSKSMAVPELLPQNQVRKGKAETTLILQKLEDALIPKNYFKNARTTGDVKAELEKQTGLPFTSRTVSQALGVLFNKKVLARVGSKGNFHYIQQ